LGAVGRGDASGPPGKGNLLGPWLRGSNAGRSSSRSRMGWGQAHSWVSGEPRVWCVHSTSNHQSPRARGCAEPQEPPRASPGGRCPHQPSLPPDRSKDPGSCTSYTQLLSHACKTLSISIKKASSSLRKEKICRVKIKT